MKEFYKVSISIFRSYGTGKTDDIFNLMLEEDSDDQFPIFPSAVQG